MALSFWTPWGRSSSSSPPRRSQRRHHPFGLASWRRNLAKSGTPMIEESTSNSPSGSPGDPSISTPSTNTGQYNKRNSKLTNSAAKPYVRRRGWRTWTRDTTGQWVRRLSYPVKHRENPRNISHSNPESTSPSIPSPVPSPSSPSDTQPNEDQETNDSGCGKSLSEEDGCSPTNPPRRKEFNEHFKFPMVNPTPDTEHRPNKSILEEDKEVDVPRMFSRWKDAFWGDAFWRRLEAIFTSPHGTRDLGGEQERRLSQIPADPSTLPDRHGLKVFVGTWNMNGREPPVALSPFLPNNRDGQQPPSDVPNNHLLPMTSAAPYHLLVIGTQECLSTAANAVFFAPEYEAWENRLSNWFGSEYFLIGSQGMGAVHLAVFVWNRCWHWIRAVESAEVATGIGGMIGNKGAVGISVLFGETSLLFINSHLAAHTERISQRNHDYTRIEKEMQLRSYELKDEPKENADLWRVSDQFDYTFWFGDLNYRTTATRAQADDWLSAGHYKRLLARDQLTRERTAQRVFHNYDEAPITFPPTYKFDVLPATSGKNGWRRAFTIETASLRSLRIRASSISSNRSEHNNQSSNGNINVANSNNNNNGTEDGSDAESVHSYATTRAETIIADRSTPERVSVIIPPSPISSIPRYDTSPKQRVPSWTDRILFRQRSPPQPSRRPRSETNLSALLSKSTHNHQHRKLTKKSSAIMFSKQRPSRDQQGSFSTIATSIRCLAYNGVMQMLGSDHRPVTGVYRIPFDWSETLLRDAMVPLSPCSTPVIMIEGATREDDHINNVPVTPRCISPLENVSSSQLTIGATTPTTSVSSLLSPVVNSSTTSIKESKRNQSERQDNRLRVPANVVAARTERLRNRQRRELQTRTLLKSPPSRDSIRNRPRKTPIRSVMI